MNPRRHFLEPILVKDVKGDAVHVLVSERTGQQVADTIELAADSKTRTRGLLGRAGLANGTVMVIAPCNAVHTFFMRFTIDVAFVDREGRILKLCCGLKPWRVGIAARAFAALEFAEGSLERAGLVQGDRLTVTSRSSDSGLLTDLSPYR